MFPPISDLRGRIAFLGGHCVGSLYIFAACFEKDLYHLYIQDALRQCVMTFGTNVAEGASPHKEPNYEKCI